MERVSIAAVRFDSPEVQRLLDKWQEELIATIPGFSPAGGSLVDANEFEPPGGAFLVARSGEAVVGCGGVRRLSRDTAEVKRLFVDPGSRGHGFGSTLLKGLERRAAASGFSKLRLDTDGGQDAALRLFRSAGYCQIGDYNSNPYASYWFEKALVAQ